MARDLSRRDRVYVRVDGIHTGVRLGRGDRLWGRVVPDIPAFCRELVAALVEQ